MRIISGTWRGRRLRSPRGRAARPTADRVREAVFSILGERTAGARVLDLFAGTGALGLESLSRGASSAVLVESDPRVHAVARRNVEELGAAGAETLLMDFRAALRFLHARGSRFDLVFLDPPYGTGMAQRAARELAGAHVLAPDAAVVIEESARTVELRLPRGWEFAEDRRYGDTRVMIFVAGKGTG